MQRKFADIDERSVNIFCLHPRSGLRKAEPLW